MATRLPRVSKKGFDLSGDQAQVLLLHGYTGSPYDLRPVADFLNRHNCRVAVPLLCGHGNDPKELFHVQAEDWLTQSLEVLNSFDEKRSIVVGGLSMGALLAIILAASQKNIKTLLLFSPALRLGLLADLTKAFAKLGLMDKNSSLKKPSGESDIADPLARQKSPSYPEMPIAGLLQFDRLRLMAEVALPKVACPIFMAFGKLDAAIDAHDSRRVITESTIQPVFSKFYDNSKHVVTLDYDRDELCKNLWQFLKCHLET